MAPRFARSAAAAIVAASLALVAACNGQTTADSSPTKPPTTNSPMTSPSFVNTPTSSSSTTSTSTPTEWPSTLTPSQVTAAEAAIAAYRGFFAFYDQAMTEPSKDWSTDAAHWSADPIKSTLLDYFKASAKQGQSATGSTVLNPTVTNVESGLVTITACVDGSGVDLFDQAGQSIKAPNQSGSFWRHPSVVQVGKYQGDRWLVTQITDTYTETC